MPGRKLRGPWRLRAFNVDAEPLPMGEGRLAGFADESEEYPDFAPAAARAGELMGDDRVGCVVLDALREARPAARRHVFGPEDVVRRITAGAEASR